MLLKLSKQRELKLFLTAAIAFFLLTLLFSLHRHYSFYSSYDQGIFNQIFWNSIQGRLFESSLSSQLSTNVVHSGNAPEVFYRHLGQHFNPIFLLWLPLYALFPDPATLTILQVILVTAAGLVLYVLARHYLQPALAAMIAISFYCANTIIGPTLANFHDISSTPLLAFSLLLAMEKRCWWLFSLFAILLLGIRQDSGVVLFSIGVYLVLSRRHIAIGVAVSSLSIAYMLLLTSVIMPIFSQDVSQRMMIERFGQYATDKQASPLEIIWAIISNPLRLLVQVCTPFVKKVKYLLGHWLPLALVPAISPTAWLVAGFPILYIFLQRGQSPLAINIRYAMPVVPGLFYGAIIWWSTRQELFKKYWLRRFWIICISLSLIFTLTSSPNRTFYFLFPDSYSPLVYVPLTRQWEHVNQMQPLLAQIPPEASVSGTTYIIPHLSSRRAIIRLPLLQFKNDQREVMNVDYAIADLWQMQTYQVAFKQEGEGLQTILGLIDRVTGNKEYGIIGFKDGVILLQKGVSSNLEAMTAWLSFRQALSVK